ncbi:MAG: DUF4373 domain-containing protein, partial [Desulfobulbaceae bacterium]|nr:DUF4373 domain-containing protein [Desulfobulbaceae bacterium]
MGRPIKDNVDYFPHFTKSRAEKLLYILEQQYGNDGYAVWYKILEVLGDASGHYFRFDNPVDWNYLVSIMKVDEGQAIEMLQLMAALGAIDPDLHAQKCLWSDEFIAGLRPVYAKRKQELPNKPSFRDGNPSKEELTEVATPETPQRKEKERKEKKESTSYSCPELSETDTTDLDELEYKPEEVSPEIMRIPLINRDGEFIVRQADIDQWADTFPGVDVVAALKRCRQ